MKSTCISEHIAKFKSTWSPYYIVKATLLIINQKRILELIYGFFCIMFSRPSRVDFCRHDTLQAMLSDCQSWLHRKRLFYLEDIRKIFGNNYAVHLLPKDFSGATREGIVHEKEFMIIGEYGEYAKRIAYITRKSCMINDYYTSNPYVRHIHAIYKSSSSKDILVTTGDSGKFLDLWTLHNSELLFKKRLKKYFGGHTAITNIAGKYYLGTDFSNRPNYIERLNGKKFFFPRKAYKMYVLGFYPYLNRYILSVNYEFKLFGGRHTLSVFDTVTEKFIFCDYLNSHFHAILQS